MLICSFSKLDWSLSCLQFVDKYRTSWPFDYIVWANTTHHCSPETYTGSFMFLSSSANARLPLCAWVEKARLHKPCGGVWGQLLLIYQHWHYQQYLVKRELVIQNSGATLAVKQDLSYISHGCHDDCGKWLWGEGFGALLSHQWVLP